MNYLKDVERRYEMIMEVKCKEKEVTHEVLAWNPPMSWVRETIEKAGTTIGSVHFRKRSDGKLRKMSYRLHCSNPSVAKKPSGNTCRQTIDHLNDMMTVFDCNKVIYDKEGDKIGRGAYRTIPLERVTRICNKGVVYKIET
jgi:hypothetical protein